MFNKCLDGQTVHGCVCSQTQLIHRTQLYLISCRTPKTNRLFNEVDRKWRHILHLRSSRLPGNLQKADILTKLQSGLDWTYLINRKQNLSPASLDWSIFQGGLFNPSKKTCWSGLHSDKRSLGTQRNESGQKTVPLRHFPLHGFVVQLVLIFSSNVTGLVLRRRQLSWVWAAKGWAKESSFWQNSTPWTQFMCSS